MLHEGPEINAKINLTSQFPQYKVNKLYNYYGSLCLQICTENKTVKGTPWNRNHWKTSTDRILVGYHVGQCKHYLPAIEAIEPNLENIDFWEMCRQTPLRRVDRTTKLHMLQHRARKPVAAPKIALYVVVNCYIDTLFRAYYLILPI